MFLVSPLYKGGVIPRYQGKSDLCVDRSERLKNLKHQVSLFLVYKNRETRINLIPRIPLNFKLIELHFLFKKVQSKRNH
jgi:hypothetical protein